MAICRSCGAEIIWIKMKGSGKAMPCDARKISFDLLLPGAKGEGVMTLVEPEGVIARGIFNPGGEKIGYLSHFATCPNANQHRRKNE